MLTVVIPGENVEGTIGFPLQTLWKHFENKGIPYEVIVVLDAPTDSSEMKVTKISRKHPSIRCICNLEKQGFHICACQGLLSGQGDYLVLLPADERKPIEVIEKLLSDLETCSDLKADAATKGYADIILGKRSPIDKFSKSIFFQRCASIVLPNHYKDPFSPYIAFRRNAAQKVLPLLRLHGLSFHVELLCRAI